MVSSIRRCSLSTVRLVLLTVAGTVLLGCGPERDTANAASSPDDGRAPLLVLAAADLQAALPEIVAAYEAASGRRVQLMLGSTGNLTTQVEHGAPGDLFFAANESFIDRLTAEGLTLPETRRIYAIGPLVLVSAPGVPLPQDVAALADPAYSPIAIANPEHAPYGMAAREALLAAGIWEQVQRRLVYGENIAQALQFVRTGNANAGIVALGLVVQSPGVEYRRVDPVLHAPLRQTAVVLRGTSQPDEARAFLGLVMSDTGQAILRRHGFEPPEPS